LLAAKLADLVVLHAKESELTVNEVSIINNDDKFYFIVGPLERKDESIWIG